MKKCTICLKIKPLDEYHKNSSKLSGVQSQCKLCRREKNREYYEKTKTRRRAVGDRRKAHKYELRKYMYEYYQKHPCIDCGENNVLCLQMDHRDPSTKFKEVSKIVAGGYKKEVLISEIEKCDVRCANCHHKKTGKDFGWYKEFIDSE